MVQRRIWKVVGGADRCGILVREGMELSSQKLQGRLCSGALVEEVVLEGERLNYRRLSGEGPETGWVSVRVQQKDLLVRLPAGTAPRSADVEAERRSVDLGDFGGRTESYCIVRCSSTGECLSDSGEVLSMRTHAGDDCMWVLASNDALRSATSGRTLGIARHSQRDDFHLRMQDGALLTGLGSSCRDSTARPGVFKLFGGPSKLPSAHLSELARNGVTTLERVVPPDGLARLKAELARVRAERFSHEAGHGGHFWMMDMLKETPDLCRAVAHPVALWILQQYLGSDVHYCHQPIVNTLRPAKKTVTGADPDVGQNYWHSDYPYHESHLLSDEWPDSVRLGVQYNICIDEFRKDNGATQFIVGSHLRNAAPPPGLNRGAPGRSQTPGAVQLEAPAGAAFLYDARMWHRQCPELNVSGQDRIGVLNAAAPAWVVPMLDKKVEAVAYVKSTVPTELNERDRNVLYQMCCMETLDRVPKIVVGKPRSSQCYFGRQKGGTRK